MNDDTRDILFGELLILAVAIGVALMVVALLLAPCFYFFRRRPIRILMAVGAIVFAVAAVIFGALSFTGWALYTGGGGQSPGIGQWLGFAVVNAILAAGAGIPGAILGMVIGLLTGRPTGQRTEVPPPAGGAEGSQRV